LGAGFFGGGKVILKGPSIASHGSENYWSREAENIIAKLKTS
jgi:hypothetical protein